MSYHAILFILTKYWRDFLNWRGKSSRGCANRCTSSASGLSPVFGGINCFNSITGIGRCGLNDVYDDYRRGYQMLDKVARSKRNGLIIAISIGCGLAVTTRPELLDKLPHFSRSARFRHYCWLIAL